MRAAVMIAVYLASAITAPESAVYVDQSQAAGIHFEHKTGAAGEKLLMETMGGGGAFLDYDNDGWLDIYLVNGGASPGRRDSQKTRNALYRNNRDGTFTDVTERAGVSGEFYGMGVSCADYDNDGFTDLFITGYGGNSLYRNRGDGTFENVTRRAGLETAPGWATSSAWLDYDGDGYLDLIVAYYLQYPIDPNVRCGEAYRPGFRSYCHPDQFAPVSNRLYHNHRDGTFTDVTTRAGLADKPGKGLGVIAADLNGDGRPDLFVANDSVANFLFLNNGDGTFREVGLESGAAYSENGVAFAGMGVDAADFDRDGLPDLLITNLEFEGATLYHNRGVRDGVPQFVDVARERGLAPTLRFVGFGAKFLDFDNDGRLDIAIVNGHVIDNIEQVSDTIRYAQPKLLFRNSGAAFQSVEQPDGSAISTASVGRGLALGDYDNDGRLDLLVVNSGGRPNLLRNALRNGNHWVEFSLQGTVSNRDGVGAIVSVQAGGDRQIREAAGGSSYLSAHSPRLHFGLGPHQLVNRVEVRWPSGHRSVLEQLGVDRVVSIKEPNLEKGAAQP